MEEHNNLDRYNNIFNDRSKLAMCKHLHQILKLVVKVNYTSQKLYFKSKI